MNDLDTLRPEVREALDDLSYFLTGTHNHDDFYTIRAELLRLQSTESRANEWQLRAEKAEAELAESRETIKRLNRRAQLAEAGVVEKVREHAGGSLGRALANAAAEMFRRERDEAQAELAALKARIADSPIASLVYGQGDLLAVISAENPDDWAGKRVRLVVEE